MWRTASNSRRCSCVPCDRGGTHTRGMTAYEPPGTPGPAAPYDAVVLAGGAARRLGGADKPGLRVGGRPLLDRVLAACATATTTVVVAEPRRTARPVEWAREEPPGGGPLAALDAGLRHVSAEHVVVLSADLPFLDEATVRRLLGALRTGDAPRVRRDPTACCSPTPTAATSRSWPPTARTPCAGSWPRSPSPTAESPGCRCGGSPPRSTSPASPTPSRPSTATPGTTSPPPGPASGSMGTCWMNGFPQSRTSWASTWTSTPAPCSTWPATPRTVWPGPRRR